MTDIFISYAREDAEKAEQVAATLGRMGWAVFWDRTIPIGKTWHTHIGTELQNARAVLVLWSAVSVASEWVLEEAEVGKRRNVLVPAMLDQVAPPIGFSLRQSADLSTWRGGTKHPEFVRLLDALESILGTESGPSPEKELVEERTSFETELSIEEDVGGSEIANQLVGSSGQHSTLESMLVEAAPASYRRKPRRSSQGLLRLMAKNVREESVSTLGPFSKIMVIVSSIGIIVILGSAVLASCGVFG